jgi:ribose transport system permease protein
MTMQATKRPTAASDRAGRARGVLTTVIKSRTTPIFGVLLVLFAVFSVLKPNAFPQLANAQNMLSDAAILLVLAVGSTYVILTAGIDLSINGVLVFSGVIAAKTLGAVGGSGMGMLLLGLLVSLLAGLAWGLLNGFLVAVAKVPALIVTLGTLGMSLGAALLITKGIDVTDIPINLTTGLGAGRIWGVPWLAVVALIVALIGGITLSQTRFGRYTYAAGSQAEALRRSGVSTARHLVKVYAIAGLLAGLAGYLNLARFATTTIGGHSTDNLQVIAAVVIGGTSLFGGIGGILGSIVGVFIPVVLQNGFVILGLSPFWQQVAVGAVLIAAVYVDQLRRRSRELG